MRHTYSSLSLQIYAVLHFCPWYFYKKLEAKKKKSIWQWDCILPREMKIQDQVSITAPLYRGYLLAPQYTLGASLRPLVKLLICPTSQRKLVKPSFFCDSHGYNTKIPRFSEAGITLWRDLFKVKNPPVSSMVIIFAIITSGVSQGTRNHSVSKRRNLTHKECVTLLIDELRHQTVDGEFWWQFRN